jgi:hypothetical protein
MHMLMVEFSSDPAWLLSAPSTSASPSAAGPCPTPPLTPYALQNVSMSIARRAFNATW